MCNLERYKILKPFYLKFSKKKSSDHEIDGRLIASGILEVERTKNGYDLYYDNEISISDALYFNTLVSEGCIVPEKSKKLNDASRFKDWVGLNQPSKSKARKSRGVDKFEQWLKHNPTSISAVKKNSVRKNHMKPIKKILVNICRWIIKFMEKG